MQGNREKFDLCAGRQRFFLQCVQTKIMRFVFVSGGTFFCGVESTLERARWNFHHFARTLFERGVIN
jgi:hypothetical protein